MRRCTAESGHSATLRFGVESTSAVQCSAAARTTRRTVDQHELETGKSVPGTLPPSHRPRVADAEAAKIKKDGRGSSLGTHTVGLSNGWHFGLVCVCFRLEQGMRRAQSHPAVMPQSVLSRPLMRDGAAYLADYTYVPWRASANLAASTRTMLWCM
jgi:hypothetical protein